MKVRGKHAIYSLILLVTGFMIAFSYQYTKEERKQPTNDQWKREDQLRSSILSIQRENRNLQRELEAAQKKVSEMEEEIADKEKRSFNFVEEIKKLRKVVGQVAVEGQGISVSLEDSSYIPDTENPNDYIVHEEHIRMVIHELYVTGAEAVAINGQRISNTTHIDCVGPVVSVDGVKHPAPFVITAIGDPEVFSNSLNLTGNITDQLVNDGVQVRIQKETSIEIPPFIAKEG
ncbi:DUF881 domain-containing protein [Pseudalkalibacillus salsuginis]|uniref:DUF881 domain-containing protein n=1 Tax=Pseudalkalibacillus salsuginis TaxID=2910972 RepID=UPI001F236292|nr:DUF881 domain-containing protein [Pseudalkalibacillus salsuginis]MCF6410473.1 DUF881 domain-containing protein [Pseudalkalibacillus salsuginis]